MKRGFIVLTLGCLLAGPVSARIGQVDPTQLGTADINGRRVDLPLVDLSTVELPVIRGQGTAPASRKRVSAGNIVETRHVKMNILEFDRVETPIRSQPGTNFSAKRAVDTNQREKMGTVATPAAKIPKYRIVVNSPEGQEELKRQLNRRP